VTSRLETGNIEKLFLRCRVPYIMFFCGFGLGTNNTPPPHPLSYLGLRDSLEAGVNVLGEADMLEHHAKGLAHHEWIGMEVYEAGRLMADNSELGSLDRLGGEGHMEGGGQLGLCPGPVQVSVHQLTCSAKLPRNIVLRNIFDTAKVVTRIRIYSRRCLCRGGYFLL
jgi:hypothetical protein